jgi:hypothetical protein
MGIVLVDMLVGSLDLAYDSDEVEGIEVECMPGGEVFARGVARGRDEEESFQGSLKVEGTVW